MVDKIYEIKNKLIEKVDKDIREYGLDRLDTNNLGETVDMIKDLAEAEEKCWKATYYRAVTEAMGQEKSGYNYGGGTGSSTPYRQGYTQQMSRQGYHSELDDLLRKLQEVDPQERERMKNEVFSRMNAM